MSIAIIVTNQEFYLRYKNHEYLRGMSLPAVDQVLEHMSEMSEDGNQVVDWTPFFMNAHEYSQQDFIDEFADKVLEADEKPEDIDDLVVSIIENMNSMCRVVQHYGPFTDTYVVF